MASGSPPERVRLAWRALPRERRLAVGACLGLVLCLFLPWYQETVIARGTTKLNTLTTSLTGWGAFSFVEAAVLLVAAGVMALLFLRAEGRAFHLPGGDGGVVTAAGVWACLLIAWRMFDKQGTADHRLYTTASGIEWGIFVALGLAALLAYAGSRIRHVNAPEPPLPGDSPAPRPNPQAPRSPAAPAPSPVQRVARDSRPRRRVRPTALSEAGESPRRPRHDETGGGAPLRSPRQDDPTARTRVVPREESWTQPTRTDRSLDLSDLERLQLDEPPEPPTVRRPDPPTQRLDRPDERTP